MKYFLMLLIFMISCNKNHQYTCVCYNKQAPENYQKYAVNNTFEEATANCNIMSNSQQTCKITE